MMLRLAIFDLDGTLKEARDPYIYLHERLGTLEAAAEFTELGLAGVLAYEEWLRLDAELWQGVPRVKMERIFQENAYLPGAQETVRALKEAGVYVAVVSTGLLLQAEMVQAELGLDWIVANEIGFEDGVVSGKSAVHVPEGGKGQIVAQLQAELGVGPDECLAVGDSRSDAEMFARVHVGVAVNPASEHVRTAADLVLEGPDLRPLLAKLRKVAPGWIPDRL